MRYFRVLTGSSLEESIKDKDFPMFMLCVAVLILLFFGFILCGGLLEMVLKR